MESKKFQDKLRNWAISLGFRLPDGSVPTCDYFTSLAITPRRYQLWEVVTDSIQSRHKVEQIKKQLLVAKILNKNYPKSVLKHSEDELDLWGKLNKLQKALEEKNNEFKKLERNLMGRAHDSLFELDTLAELEKQCSDLKEKILFIKLFREEKEKISKDLVKRVFYWKQSSREPNKEDLKQIKDEIMSEVCEESDGEHHCNVFRKLERLCNSGITEQQLWMKVIEFKKNLLEEIDKFLEEFNFSKKHVLSDTELEIEKKIYETLIELKQKITETSLQVALSSTEDKILDLEVEKLVEEVIQREENENQSFLSMNETTCEEKENLRKYLNLMGLKKYKEFLTDEMMKIEEEEVIRIKRKELNEKKGEEGFQSVVKEFESTVGKINSTKANSQKIEEEIFKTQEKVKTFLQSLFTESQDKTRTHSVVEITEKLTSSPEKQLETFLNTPMDAFRTFENSSGRTTFEWESPSHRLRNYSGDLKSFCPAMLLPPVNDLGKILLEIQRRNKTSSVVKTFLTEREKLIELERDVLTKVKSVKYDGRLCEKNFQKCEKIMEDFGFLAENTTREIELIEKILKYWLEQPYRFMIRKKEFTEYEKQLK